MLLDQDFSDARPIICLGPEIFEGTSEFGNTGFFYNLDAIKFVRDLISSSYIFYYAESFENEKEKADCLLRWQQLHDCGLDFSNRFLVDLRDRRVVEVFREYARLFSIICSPKVYTRIRNLPTLRVEPQPLILLLVALQEYQAMGIPFEEIPFRKYALNLERRLETYGH